MYQNNPEQAVRISLPSKGRLAEDTRSFLTDCGLAVYQPNPRQYEAKIPNFPGISVLFQRPADIVVGVRDGSVDFGITGLDVVEERRGENGEVMILHDALGYGECMLTFAAPDGWKDVTCVGDLTKRVEDLGRPLRVATKYPFLADRFLRERGISATLITAEGTLETAPMIGYADVICDIVSSGQTLRDNRLRPLEDGLVIKSQAVLIANRQSLLAGQNCLETARTFLEFFEAHLRSSGNLSVFANMRGDSPESIAERIFSECNIPGLQGPTISRIIVREEEQNWYAVNIIVPHSGIIQAIRELRAIGGSGVVVVPVTYIFDEEPMRITAMLQALTKPA
jgi:ATP phosphoribosyltransferase